MTKQELIMELAKVLAGTKTITKIEGGELKVLKLKSKKIEFLTPEIEIVEIEYKKQKEYDPSINRYNEWLKKEETTILKWIVNYSTMDRGRSNIKEYVVDSENIIGLLDSYIGYELDSEDYKLMAEWISYSIGKEMFNHPSTGYEGYHYAHFNLD